jgi:EAL and modified HD-GYP domain-containing signal transduction protein
VAPDVVQREAHFARQPILHADGRLAGFELLAHGGARAAFGAVTTLGLRDLSRGVPAFLSAHPDVLLEVDPLPFAPDGVVLQVPSHVLVTDALLGRLEEIAGQGFRIVLDGALHDSPPELLRLATGVRIPVDEPGSLRVAAAAGFDTIATGVATQADLRAAHAAGFTMYQGDVVCAPRTERGLTAGSAALNRLRTAAALADADDVDAIEHAVRLDPALALRLLRFINSAAFSLRSEVRSVRHAAALLGPLRVRQWSALVLLADGGGGEVPIPATTGLARARTCEAIGTRLGMPDRDAYFLVGLLSVADALLDAPLPDVLAQLPLADDLQAALLRRAGGKGRALAMAEACERGAWDEAAIPGLDAGALAALHVEALRWADTTVAGLV